MFAYEKYAPALEELLSPTRDKIIIRSAVVAGCGIMALLGRHAAITVSALTNLPIMFSLPFSLSYQSVFIAV